MEKTMTVAYAQEYKKKLVEQLQELSRNVSEFNSLPSEAVREIDVLAAQQQKRGVRNFLVRLKIAIDEASHPQRKLVIQKGEALAEIADLRSLDTSHGKKTSRWSRLSGAQTDEAVYEAIIRKADVDKALAQLQQEVARLQYQINTLNAQTLITIEVPDDVVQPVV